VCVFVSVLLDLLSTFNPLSQHVFNNLFMRHLRYVNLAHPKTTKTKNKNKKKYKKKELQQQEKISSS